MKAVLGAKGLPGKTSGCELIVQWRSRDVSLHKTAKATLFRVLYCLVGFSLSIRQEEFAVAYF